MSCIVLTLDTEQFSGGAEDLKQLAEGIQAFINILRNASPDYCEAGSLLQRQLDEQLSEQRAHSQVREIIDWSESETDWSEIVDTIKSKCKIENAEYITVRVVRDFGYRRKDAHVPNPSTVCDLTDNLYDYLNDLVQDEDCKNGCQLYQESDGTYYFQITGANFYDKENNYAGTDTVKVWFKEFVWNN